MTDLEDRYAELCAAFLQRDGVRQDGKGFGSSALKVHGRIFAMLTSRGQFVVKLPRQRVAALIGSGEGAAYDAGKGKPMKEWVAVPPKSRLDWTKLAEEALEFVQNA